MNSTRKGNGRELRTAAILEADGWLVGTRRHTAGAGDLLAIKAGHRPRLIEVKATATAYAHFGPGDRRAMVNTAYEFSADAELAWWAPRAKTHQIIPESAWP